MEKRIFIADRECGESMGELISILERNTKIEIRINKERLLKKIPRDFDAYILHLSEINEKDLEELRKEQPWSWVYGSSGAIGNTPLPIRECLDREYYILSPDNMKDILNQIKNYRKNGSKN